MNNNIIQLNKYRRSFNIKVVYDEDVMEVVELKYPRKFTKLHSLEKADILKDVSDKTDVDRDKHFNAYTKSLGQEKLWVLK